MYEVIVFTASHEAYANQVIDLLDPKGKYISKRVFRESCYETPERVLIKDLRIFGGRRLQDIAIVDNSLYCYGFQLPNGIPILPFYGNEGDRELIELENFLIRMYDKKNLVNSIKNYFQTDLFYEKADRQDELIMNLFGRICKHVGEI